MPRTAAAGRTTFTDVVAPDPLSEAEALAIVTDAINRLQWLRAHIIVSDGPPQIEQHPRTSRLYNLALNDLDQINSLIADLQDAVIGGGQ